MENVLSSNVEESFDKFLHADPDAGDTPKFNKFSLSGDRGHR